MNYEEQLSQRALSSGSRGQRPVSFTVLRTASFREERIRTMDDASIPNLIASAAGCVRR